MSFIYVIHLMCWNYLIDLITQQKQKQKQQKQQRGLVLQKGAKRGPPFVVTVPAVVSFVSVSVSVVCDQVD